MSLSLSLPLSLSLKVCNMHLERQLASAKTACPMKFPLAERLSCTAYLGGLLRTHTAAGGRDCRFTRTRKELLRKGVKLAAQPTAKKSKKRPKRRSGLFTFMKGRSPAQPMDRQAYVQHQRSLVDEFKALPDEMKQGFAAKEYLQAQDARSTAMEGPHAEDPGERYARLVGHDLWGLSEFEFPVSLKAVDAVMTTALGHPFSSLRSAVPVLRKRLESIFVPDAGLQIQVSS